MIITIIILLVIDLLVVSYLVEKEEPNPIVAVLFIAGSLTLFHFLVAKIDYNSALEWCKDNTAIIIAYATAWVILGVVWSFIRWYIFLLDVKKSRDSYLQQIDNGVKGGVNLQELLNRNRPIPKAAANKERIISWMIYFPFSIIAVMFRNWIARFYSFLYNKVSGIYDSITNSVYKDEANSKPKSK